MDSLRIEAANVMPDDAEYYRQRAAQAQSHAETATLPEVRCVHAEMAERYRMLQQEAERVETASGLARPRPRLGIVQPN